MATLAIINLNLTILFWKFCTLVIGSNLSTTGVIAIPLGSSGNLKTDVCNNQSKPSMAVELACIQALVNLYRATGADREIQIWPALPRIKLIFSALKRPRCKSISFHAGA